jgi:hypothetical protein
MSNLEVKFLILEFLIKTNHLIILILIEIFINGDNLDLEYFASNFVSLIFLEVVQHLFLCPYFTIRVNKMSVKTSSENKLLILKK